MIDYEKLAAVAKECGFTHSAPLSVSTLEFMPEVREMCNAKQCNRYGKSWSCPPECPPLDELRNTVTGYEGGVLVQTVGELEDNYDWEGIQATGAAHKENYKRMQDRMIQEYQTVFAMGAGTCTLCEECTYPDEPCRSPEKMSYSMEASGLFVSKVCTDNGLAYNYGPKKLAFTSCFLV